MTDQPTIVSPSVDQLVVRARALVATGERRLLGITGAPGSGKSTLGPLWWRRWDDAVLVGMDGFHRSNQELRRLGRYDRKGVPDTFDVDGYVALLARLRHRIEPAVHAPMFDRALTPSPPRCRYLDEVWFVNIARDLRRQRLITRRRSLGHSATAAAEWVQTVDERNAARVEETAPAATLLVTMTETPTQAPQQTN